jgi:hypothetical protein
MARSAASPGAKDGRELYYLNEDRATSEIKVLAVDVNDVARVCNHRGRELFR